METKYQEFLATCPLGAEALLAEELQKLGVKRAKRMKGRVRFSTDFKTAMKACLMSRIASRIMQPIAQFKAPNAMRLYEEASKIPFEEYLSSLNSFAIHGIGQNNEIRHSGFLALKIKDALVDRMRAKVGKRPNVDKHAPDVRFIARLSGQNVSLSLDLAAGGLHMRGWRDKGQLASLKENLAAAILRLSGWQEETPLVDPMCGGGTLLIEAASMAMKTAPNWKATFGFERWPTLSKSEKAEFNALKRSLSKSEKPLESLPKILGGDNDPSQIRQAARHAEQAGLARVIDLRIYDFVRFPFPETPFTLVANPPYGERIMHQETKALIRLYDKLGKTLRKTNYKRLAIFSAFEQFEEAFGMEAQERIALYNGAIETTLYRFER